MDMTGHVWIRRALCVAATTALVIALPASGAIAGHATRRAAQETGVATNQASSRVVIADDGGFITFLSSASNLGLADSNLVADIYVYDLTTGVIERASVTDSPSGSPAQATAASSGTPAITADGRFVAFETSATNLRNYPNTDKNVKKDIYVRDRLTGRTELVSTTDSAEPYAAGNGDSTNPAISDDGRYVAFTSASNNFVWDDLNNQPDVFVYDRVLDTIERVSLTTVGGESNGTSLGRVSISGDGRFIAFESGATNLVPNDFNVRTDVFLRDRGVLTDAIAPDTFRMSVSSSQVEGNNNSNFATVSNDGRYVSYHSLSTNLVAGDTNGQTDAFVRDKVAGTTERISVSTSAAQATGGTSINPWISPDGATVAFSSSATNLVPADYNAKRDVFVRSRTEARTYVGSRTTFGAQGTAGDSDYPSIEGSGKKVAFESGANNLITNPDDSNSYVDVFVHDLSLMPEIASKRDDGTQPSAPANRPSVSRTGRYVAFHSTATDLVAGDTNAKGDVFVVDRYWHTVERVSVADDESEANGGSRFASMSGDGRYVAFVSDATNLVPGSVLADTNGKEDIYVRDRTGGSTERVSASSGNAANPVGKEVTGGDSRFPSISDSGRYVAFQSLATDVVAGDSNATWDVFLRDRWAPGYPTTIRVSVDGSGGQADTGSPRPISTRPSVATGGGFVVFHSWATDLVDGASVGGADTNGQPDVFIRDWAGGITERVSLDTAENQATGGPSQFPTVSSSGRYVVYQSEAANLVSGDTNAARDVFRRDRTGGSTLRVSLTSAGGEANGISGYATVAGNDTSGSFITYHSEATNLLGAGFDLNGVRDCYARWIPNAGSAQTWRVAVSRDGIEADDWSGTCVPTSEGAPVVFQSTATNLLGTGNDLNGGVQDVFAVEAAT